MFRATLLALAILPGLSASALAQGRAPRVAPDAPATSAPATPGPATPGPATPGGNRILTVVNGDVVTQSEVRSRTRLFALNAGMNASPEALTRLEPQVLRLLIDEKLRIQETQRRQIQVSDNDIAEALADIERRNQLTRGALTAQLRNAGIQPRVLFDQIRVQIGWGRLLRSLLGPAAEPQPAELAETIAAATARAGQPEFLVGEILVPIDDPANEAEVRRFVDEVVSQLRRGLPFAVAATQFSQAQTSLQGGDLGWLTENRLDPAVAAIVTRMPAGAISNPLRVPGGFQIVTLRAKREAGRDSSGTQLTMRQVFIPFGGRLDPQAPTDAQRAVVERAQRLAQSTRGCEALDVAARGPNPADRPMDPGPVRLEGVNPPQLRSMLASLAIGRASQPVISPDGVAILMVCAREQRQAQPMNNDQARQQLLGERVELLSRQLQRELRRRAVIETRS
ncbi:MAG: peptidylprolyl isomerase [Rubritepida sp.]|nr:peptidylprolyl isomerase [Rubritepida sp.]